MLPSHLVPLDLAAQSRLRDMQAGGGPRKVEFTGHGSEIAKLPQLHTRRRIRVRSTFVLPATARWVARHRCRQGDPHSHRPDLLPADHRRRVVSEDIADSAAATAAAARTGVLSAPATFG